MAAPTPAAAVMHTNDSLHLPAVMTNTTTASGPPSCVRTAITIYDAVARWSNGASACSPGPTPRAVTTYDVPATLVQGEQTTGMTEDPAQVTRLTFSSLAYSRVAANVGAAAVRTGQAGERAVQNAYQIGDKTPFNVLGTNRIADGNDGYDDLRGEERRVSGLRPAVEGTR